MKVVQYLQVLLLLSLLGYLVLIGLENPLTLRLPLWEGQVLALPAWQVVGGAVLLGGLYTALLFTPPAVRRALRIRSERGRRKDLEQRLSSTVQARLAEGETARPSRIVLRLGRPRPKEGQKP